MWSVCVIARDEEASIVRCLASTPASAERVVVVDDRSRDGTARWAARVGARVVRRRFDDWSAQRNAALAASRGDRILFLDADETASDALRAWMCGPDDGADAWSFPFRTRWLGRVLSHGRMGRSRHVRAVRRGRGRWVGAVHERLSTGGVARPIDACIHHDPYETVWDHLAAIERYTSVPGARGREPWPGERPVRAAWHVADALVVRGGWRDGPDGLAVAGLGALAVWKKWSARA